MKCIYTNFAHGFGPFTATTGIALDVGKKLGNNHQVIVPLVYGDKQRRIIGEDYSEILEENPEAVLFDVNGGKLLDELFYKGDDYSESLESLVRDQEKVERQFQEHLVSAFPVETLSGKEITVNPKEIEFEITHNPRLVSGIFPSFYTTIALFSELMKKSGEENLPFDKKLLRKVGGIASRIEFSSTNMYISKPSTFRVNDPDVTETPPIVRQIQTNDESVPIGMYVNVTGIPGLDRFCDKAKDFGLKLYSSPFGAEIEGSDRTHHPNFIANQNIKFHFARMGWSSVWRSHITETPLITLPYQTGDDPEMYFNESMTKELGIATFYDELRHPNEILSEAKSQIPYMKVINNSLREQFGTLDGIEYTARKIVEEL
jgi:hypothetical protein